MATLAGRGSRVLTGGVPGGCPLTRGDQQLLGARLSSKCHALPAPCGCYPLDRVAQRAALAAYADREWFETCRRRVIECREWLACALRKQGFEVAPSAANFLFVRHAQIPGVALFQALRARGILVRRWDKPRIEDHLRISIGTRKECERLVAAIAAILAEGIEAASNRPKRPA